MRHRTAFTLTDLIAGTTIAAVLLTITAATFADNRTTRQQRQNATQLRGIHQGLVTYANRNKEHFPGLNSKGEILPNDDEETGSSGAGDTPEARYWIMLTRDYMTPAYAMAPIDSRAVEYDPGEGADPWVTHVNYSFAMLDISGESGEGPDAGGRAAEWTQSLNTQSIVLSDRNCANIIEDDAEPSSIWNDEEWHGHVLWNDNHVSYEETHHFETRYGNGRLFTDQGDGNAGLDNLFADDDDSEGNSGTDALMTFSRDEDGNERAVPRVVEDDDE